MAKIVLVARDAAPSGCFSRLEPVLRERGFEVELFVGAGKPLVQSVKRIEQATSVSTIVLLGMSSSAELAEPELVAGRSALEAGIRYGFYGDVPRCWARARPGAWFEELASSTSFYLGITDNDAEGAREVFTSALCVGTGNPLREDMAFPRLTREDVRKKLGVSDEHKLILASGDKFAAGNMVTWATLIGTILRFKEQEIQLLLTLHPGDRTDLKLYDELVELSSVPTRIIPRDVLTGSEMIPGVDLVVDFGGSIGIEAAYSRVPVISLEFEVLFISLERKNGNRLREAVEAGAAMGVDPAGLEEAIRLLLGPEGVANMKKRQETSYPKPIERGVALKRIADAITRIAQVE